MVNSHFAYATTNRGHVSQVTNGRLPYTGNNLGLGPYVTESDYPISELRGLQYFQCFYCSRTATDCQP